MEVPMAAQTNYEAGSAPPGHYVESLEKAGHALLDEIERLSMVLAPLLRNEPNIALEAAKAPGLTILDEARGTTENATRRIRSLIDRLEV